MNNTSRSWTRALGITILLAACTAPSTDADGAAEGDDQGVSSDLTGGFPVGTRYVTTADVNLRSGPATSNAVLRVIPAGSVVLSASAQPRGVWYGVTFDGATGWVHGAYLQRDTGTGSATISAAGQAQMRNVLAYARAHNSGASRGRCFEYVWRYLAASGYGLINDPGDAPDMPSAYARNFAEYMNENGNAARWGLQRLAIANPYDAPVGAVVVVAAGSPGTAHPTAGDISLAAGGGVFINDGPAMGYGGSRAAFTSGGGRVLGIYVPR
jgi:SH3-like domain-containing protein